MDLTSYIIALGYSPMERPSAADLKTRWRTLCRQHHPDAGGNSEMFRKVTHAYRMLSDPAYRDKHIKDEIRRNNAGIKGDLDTRIHFPLQFEEAFFGRSVLISVNRLEFTPEFVQVSPTPLDMFSIKVDIPAGSMDGYTFAVHGEGHRSGETRGDMHINFTVNPHPKFSTQGADVVAREMIPLDLLLKGGKVDVPTMYGILPLVVRPGTKPGTRVAIRNAGLMRAGSHIVEVGAIFPTESDLKDEKWAGLDINWDGSTDEQDGDEELMRIFEAASVEEILKHSVRMR